MYWKIYQKNGLLDQIQLNNLRVVGVQDQELLLYCKELGISIDELKKKNGYILVNRPIKIEDRIRKIMWMNHNKMKNFKIYFQHKNYEEHKALSSQIYIMKNTMIEPAFKVCETNDVVYLIVPFQTVNKMIYNQKQKEESIFENIEVCYKSQQYGQLEKELEQLKLEDVFINNIAKNNRRMKEKSSLFIFGLCGFVGMLILIACTNVSILFLQVFN